MKVLKIIGIILLVVIVIVAVWVMTLSGETHLERNITINASVEKVFNVTNDFGQNKHWSPWFKIDPETVWTYSENTVGAGAYYTWSSENSNVGVGRQELLESVANERVKTQMEFDGGGTGTFTADFIFEVDGKGTKLTWTFDGKADGIGDKIFIAMSEFILGPTYEEGLVNLKTYIENLPDPEPEIEVEVMEGDSTLVVEEVTEEATTE